MCIFNPQKITKFRMWITRENNRQKRWAKVRNSNYIVVVFKRSWFGYGVEILFVHFCLVWVCLVKIEKLQRRLVTLVSLQNHSEYPLEGNLVYE